MTPGPAAGRSETLRNLSDAEIATAGPGGQEVRAWIVLAGATGGWRGEVSADEEVPVAGWCISGPPHEPEGDSKS